jgi:hypothetical protein
MIENGKTENEFECKGYTPFTLIGIVSFSLLFLPFTGLSESTVGTTVFFVAGLIGVSIGVYGLIRYSSFGLFHDDPFHMMGVLLSVGIIILALANFASGIAISMPENLVIPYMVVSARATALVLWILGIVGYVRASDQILKFAYPRLWALALVFVAAAAVIAFPVMIISDSSFGPYESSWNLFFSSVVGIIVAALYLQYYTLREGAMGKLFRYLVLGVFAMYLHGLLIWYANDILTLVLANIFTIESNVLIGIYLVCSQEMSIKS